MKNIKTLHTFEHNNTSHPFGVVAILQQWSNSNIRKNKNLVGKPGLQLRNVIRRGINSGKVIKGTFTGKFKRWHHNKKMNGFIICIEKLPYLQPSSLYLIQKESQGYRSYDTVQLGYHFWITLCILHLLDKKHDLPGLVFVNPCTYPIYICDIDKGTLRQKLYRGHSSDWSSCYLSVFLSLNRGSEYFWLTNLTIIPLSCSLLFL